MKNIWIINAHQPYPFSEGRLNQSLVDLARDTLADRGYEVRVSATADGYEVATEIENHLWADAIILQTPVNWMGVPWSFKKYMDEVYSAGMMGQLCDGDGRTRSDASQQYGTGGKLAGTKYMISLTFNAPRDSFDDPEQFFFEGRGVDDLFWPAHLNFRFFGMEPLETFACYDVMKNPNIEGDFKRFTEHLNRCFPG